MYLAYVHNNLCVHVYACTYLRTYMYICRYVYTCTCLHMYIYVKYVYVCICMHICMYAYLYVYVFIMYMSVHVWSQVGDLKLGFGRSLPLPMPDFKGLDCQAQAKGHDDLGRLQGSPQNFCASAVFRASRMHATRVHECLRPLLFVECLGYSRARSSSIALCTCSESTGQPHCFLFLALTSALKARRSQLSRWDSQAEHSADASRDHSHRAGRRLTLARPCCRSC